MVKGGSSNNLTSVINSLNTIANNQRRTEMNNASHGQIKIKIRASIIRTINSINNQLTSTTFKIFLITR